jgi:hypothetical protein
MMCICKLFCLFPESETLCSPYWSRTHGIPPALAFCLGAGITGINHTSSYLSKWFSWEFFPPKVQSTSLLLSRPRWVVTLQVNAQGDLLLLLQMDWDNGVVTAHLLLWSALRVGAVSPCFHPISWHKANSPQMLYGWYLQSPTSLWDILQQVYTIKTRKTALPYPHKPTHQLLGWFHQKWQLSHSRTSAARETEIWGAVHRTRHDSPMNSIGKVINSRKTCGTRLSASTKQGFWRTP